MREVRGDVCANASTAIMSYDQGTVAERQTAGRRMEAKAKDVQVVTVMNTSGLRRGRIPGVLEELLQSTSNVLLLLVLRRLAVL